MKRVVSGGKSEERGARLQPAAQTDHPNRRKNTPNQQEGLFLTANRAICPDLQFCYRLYQKVNKQEFGEQSGEGMLAALARQVESYNAACNDTCAKLKMSSTGTPLVAICSPLMKQTHSLSCSGEICFMDSPGNMDRENCRVFLLITHTCAGGLPLGIVITQSEDEKTIREGLELLKSLLKNDAFGGRGEAGPCLFLTDDSKAEKGAIAQVFPEATQLL
ncbi:EF-hand calcium-binding domain-containing protein 7 [Labeo rohita]|uniref:EF-hand calcium-binding domain-containing protein 7 n=1 Tax=Labeo rohita TaxID=84645 RepID=A0ABQ8LC43_LABRO|nr:EF-hand calcium-binding domain-containing protein 7 [Labeo rohita]